MRTLLIFACLWMAAQLPAQEPEAYSGGLLFEDEQYQAQPRMAPETGAKTDLPPVADLSPYCPQVRHQGHIFSCVGWAAGYGALSIQRAILNQCTDQEVITRNAHSALFLFNQIKIGDCSKGARISDAMQFLRQRGNCLAGQFDFDVNNCEQMPDEQINSSAKRFAIDDFVTLFKHDEDGRQKVFLTKRVLAADKPVVVGMNVLRNFYQLKNATYWHPEIGNTAPAGGHAMVVVGYDDRKGAFRLMNSWGRNWGDQGFIWIKYNDFGRFCKYAYAMYLAPDEKLQMPETRPIEETPLRPLMTLAGELEFRSFEGWTTHTQLPIFETQPVTRSGATFRLQKEDWEVGRRFQLVIKNMPAEQYLYIFSIDARNELRFHWPRSAALDARFDGHNESGLLLSAGTEIAIPGPDKVLKLAHAGTDRLVLLFSKRKIETIDKFAALVGNQAGDLTRNILATLGDYAVTEADIIYSNDSIAFSAATRSTGFIVPIVLEVTAQ